MTTSPSPALSAPPSESGAHPVEASRPPYLWALGTAAIVFALYAATLAPTTAFWDTSEYIATAHILGIPHPPGNPLFVVLARTWEVLITPLGLPVPVRINLFSAFMSASAHGLWFLVVHHILRYFSEDKVFRLGGAFVATVVSATAFTVWNQSNVNEKVYTVSLLTVALLSWLAFRWQENLGRAKDDNLLVLMAFVLALSVGNHLMAFLAAPAMLLFVVIVRPSSLLNWKLYPAVVLAGLVGLSIHLFLPLRAALDPVINEAAPRCEDLGGALEAIASYGRTGCVALGEALQRRQYDKPSIFQLPWPSGDGIMRTPGLFMSQLVNYLQYFDWQWARGLQGEEELFADLRIPFTMLFSGLGVWGALEHHRRDKPSFYYVLALYATLSVALVLYLNFKYGYSMPAPMDGLEFHEVRERDYFFVVSFSVWGLWAGMGLATVWSTLGERLGGLARATPVLLLAAVPLVLNWSWASRAQDYAARDWAYNLLMSVEPYGVLFTNGDNDTFPLWYLQEVEGMRKDVTVVVTSYLNTDWYTRQLRDLTRPCPENVSAEDDPTVIICQRAYTGANTNALYTTRSEAAQEQGRVPLLLDAPVRAPQRSILPLDDETIQRTAQSYVPLEQTRAFQLGNVTATLSGGTLLYPWHQFALAIVSTSLGDRPVYFATSGNSASQLGLEEYLVRQGLAFKLNKGGLPESAGQTVVELPLSSPLVPVTGRWLDQQRTDTLLNEVFIHRGGLPDWSHWPDHSTIGIPNYYAWGYYALAQAAYQQGDDEAAERYRVASDAWSQLGT